MRGDRALQRLAESLPAYELSGGELGRGNWGVVHGGVHRRLGREVAIKILPGAFAADDLVTARFQREARLAAGLEHPHIVHVFDFQTLADGSSVIVMERCVESVAAVADRGGLGQESACAAAVSALLGLDHAHRNGVLHRDVKPENLLVSRRGTVKLADFGIASGDTEQIRLTATGMVLGTPAYLSPEQAAGDPLGPASDLYATGVVLYELLAGRLPYRAGTVGALIRAHLVTEPDDLAEVAPDVGPEVAAVVGRSLAKRPEDRYPSALAMADALGDACRQRFGEDWLDAAAYTIHRTGTRERERERDEVVGLAAPTGTAVAVPTGDERPGPAGPVLIDAGGVRHPLTGDRSVIGRQRGLGVSLDEPNLSREHAVIESTDQGWVIRDLGSTNGTFVNGERVAEAVLVAGDEILLGTCHLSFHPEG